MFHLSSDSSDDHKAAELEKGSLGSYETHIHKVNEPCPKPPVLRKQSIPTPSISRFFQLRLFYPVEALPKRLSQDQGLPKGLSQDQGFPKSLPQDNLEVQNYENGALTYPDREAPIENNHGNDGEHKESLRQYLLSSSFILFLYWFCAHHVRIGMMINGYDAWMTGVVDGNLQKGKII